MDGLSDRLKAYKDRDIYPFHMPGHKRNPELFDGENCLALDITEIDGFDDLNHPEGVIRTLEERIAEMFGAEESHILVNGSTSGILSAVSAAVATGERILVARNSHKSTYHGVELIGADPVYMDPEIQVKGSLCGSVSPEMIQRAIELQARAGKPVKAICLVSPTYEGVVSDIKEIARIAHENGGILIVDEAHGAHLGFDSYFPESAVRLDADIVIQSLHKTLPAMTQTAVIHINGPRVDRELLKHYLQVYQSSSPSYILMSSVDACINVLERRGRELFSVYVKMLETARNELSELNNFKLLSGEDNSFFGYDKGKLVLCIKEGKITGKALMEMLRSRFSIEAEMCGPDYVLFMTSVADRKKGFDRLVSAMRIIDAELNEVPGIKTPDYCAFGCGLRHEIALKPGEAVRVKRKPLEVDMSVGRISADYVGLYPPGIPLLVPGEVILREHMELIISYLSLGLCPRGVVVDDDGKARMMVLGE